MTTPSINIGPSPRVERTRRKRELTLALGALVAVVLLSWLELKYFGVNSFLFLALFNVNLILLLLILFLVLRNGVKLILERRRKVLGSQLRSRLVLAFISLTLLPTIPMFLVTIKFVQTSVDYWFKSQVENSMEQALQVGQTYYAGALQDLETKGGYLLTQFNQRGLAWGGGSMDRLLGEKRAEYGLISLGVLTGSLQERCWHSDERWAEAWPSIKDQIDFSRMREDPQFWTTLWAGPGADDYLVGILPVDGGVTGFLVMGSVIGKDIVAKLDQIVSGLDEYKKLKTLKHPLKMVLYLFLGVMTLLIIFGAMWFGFRLAKEISAPVQALATGTQRIASGDLGVRLRDESVDELGLLVRSFNSMAEDLEQGQERLKQVNIRLEKQNQELEERGQYMMAVLNNVTAGVISLDSSGMISTVNRAAEAMLGLDSKALVGKSPIALLKSPYKEEVQTMLQQVQNNPGSQWQRQLELSLRNRDLKLLVNVVALKSMDGTESGFVAVFEDITELEKMQRMDAWREVARRIAHEIKNPLTPIKLSAQRLEQRYAGQVGDTVFKECTQLIVTQVEHLQQMVQEFSSFAKLPEIVPREEDLVSLLEEVVAMFRNSHSTIHWVLHIENEVPRSSFDREAMRRALVNLLTNAVEALDGGTGGQVAVVARSIQESGMIQVEIRDNGPGLSPEERSRMFEPYFSRKMGGTGLGLTIVKSIVTDHHGYVRVRPNTPAGTVFVLELPAESGRRESRTRKVL
jgi:two-component system, NtrC family, nitrogen regulation sensor histidine kinase NtrY